VHDKSLISSAAEPQYNYEMPNTELLQCAKAYKDMKGRVTAEAAEVVVKKLAVLLDDSWIMIPVIR